MRSKLIAAEQREKEEKALRSFLASSLIGSVALHIVVLTLSSLWVRTPEPAQEPIAEEPIGVMVIDKPSLKAASIGGSGRGTKSQGGSVAGGGSSIRSQSRVGRTAITQSTLLSKPTAAATASAKRDAIASIAPSQPMPVETATTRVAAGTVRTKPKSPSKPVQTRSPVATLRTKPESPPKPAQTRPPVATLPPKPELIPKPVATLPPEQASEPRPVSTPSPSPTATPELKQTSQPSRVPVAQFPHNANIPAPTQPLPARPNNPREVGARSSFAAASGNRDSGFTRSSGTRDSGQSTSTSNEPESGSRKGPGNVSGNSRAVATGSGIGNRNGLTTGSGSGTVTCRSCPIPEYPPGAEDLEGRAVVVIDVDRDGNVSNVQIAESTGHDILDQRVLETVKKKWKFTSSENGQRVRAAVDFAQQGSDFYSQAREREHQARELEQKKKRERQTH